MGDLTKNFSESEFDCNDGSDMPEDVLNNVHDLADNLQQLRDFTDRSITVNSGYRSPDYNKKIGGAKHSQHLLGKAADIVVDGLTPMEVADLLEGLIRIGAISQGGIGIYDSFTHYDIRETKARWVN